MRNTYKKMWAILDPHERVQGILLLCLFLVNGILEAIGVASIIPFMAVVGDPQLIQSNAYLSRIHQMVGAPDRHSFLIMLGLGLAVAFITSLTLNALAHTLLHRFSSMCDYRLSTRLLSSYLSKPYAWFLNNHSADLGRTVLIEISQLVLRSVLPTLRVLSSLMVVVFLLVLVFLSDPVIAIFGVFGIAGLYILIYLSLRGYLARISSESWQSNAERYRIAQEGLSAIKDIKMCGLESVCLERYSDPAKRYTECYANQAILGMLPKFLMEAIVFGGMLIVLVLLLIIRQQGLGHVLPLITVFLFAAYRLLPALQSIYFDFASMRFGIKILERLADELTLAAKSDQFRKLGESRPKNERLILREALELVDVNFSYPQAGEKALHAVNLRIGVNSTVGLVGRTGAGKTTLVDVILGLLVPDSGQLLVDSERVFSENRRRWQDTLGYVPQQIFLADDTVAANIAFGELPDSIDMEAVEKAAKIAEIHDFVTNHLSNGYQTKVGERGVRLSGGQRQRIGIARALYRDPSVLILDEATNALDTVTEKVVMSAVKRLGHKKTIIIIAHRLSTVRDCDLIFVMERGSVIAKGVYEELVQRSELFRTMTRSAR
jgi:ABC-type multidrug transport system fused ATPase/permease subunit